MRQPRTGLLTARFATALMTGGLLIGLWATPALALGPPGAPPQPTVARGNAQIVVTFSPPASDGGSPILLYTASCTSSDGGASGSNTGTASPITVSSLTNGKTYTCTVTATNALGTSSPSPASAAVVPAAAPSAPTITSATAGNASISVAFTPGADNGSAITSFSASCTSANGGTPGTHTGSASPISVSSLTNGTTYTCTVTATNAVGTSSASLPSVPATPVAAPDPPTITSVTRGNASISVAFTPGADNGSPILTYSASCTSTNGGTSGSNTGTASPITVSSLTNGKTYTCTVTATNAIGTSSPSAASASVVPATVPDAPAQPTVTRGNQQIVVTFTAPANNGSAITSYSASCTSLDGGAPGSNTGAASPITVSSLTNGKTYTCTVTATNGVGTSSASLPSLPVVPAAVPDAPTITSVTRGNASISVAFTPGADNGSPILTYSASCTSSDGGASGSNTGTASPITVSSLTNGKTYTCTVTEANAVGTSSPSVASATVVPAVAPSAPAITSATAGNASISVAFTPGSDNGSAITSFSASCTSANGGASGTHSGAASPITVNSLTNGKTYTCTVTATNGVGTSGASLPSAPVIPASVPDPPTITSVTRGNAQVVVAFSAPANDGGLQILTYGASCTSTNGGTSGSNPGTTSPITVSGLTNGKTYTCTVTATNAVGTSSPSAASATVVPAAVPDAPTITSVTRGNASISVAFTPGADNGSPILTYSASCTSSNGGAAGTNSGALSPITVSGLTNGKTYTCTVTATNAVGTSPPSAVSQTVVPATVPDAPPQPSVTRGNQQIVVTFSPPASDGGSVITSYTASCSSSDGGASGTNSGAASPITVTGLTNGKTYTCTVTATNDVGTGAASTASPTVVPATVPDAPAQPSVTRGNHQIVVTLSPPADNGSPITSYTASCTSTNGGAAGSRSGAASPVTVTGLTNGKTYTCTVTATNGVGTSPASPASAAIVPAGVPNPPGIGAVTTGDGTALVAFTVPADNGDAITSYTATCTSSNGGASGTNTGAASPITVSGLTNGSTYACRVTATNGVGTSAASAASATFVPGIPGPPINVRAAPGPTTTSTGSLKVSFTAGPDYGSTITSYRASCTSANGGAPGSGTASASPVTVAGLDTAKIYLCRVTATNARGTSAASAPARATVGAPGVVVVLRSLPVAHGLALPFIRPAGNGSAITGYRADCTSSNGGVTGSPLRTDSPIVATGLTDGKTYRCIVTAKNARGSGPETLTASVVAGRPNVTYLASCSGNTGSVGVSPGLLYSSSQTQTFSLASTIGSCTGPYVTSARISISFRSASGISCQNAINAINSGSGSIFWPSPRGMGKSAVTLRFVITSTSGHVTQVHFYGDVRSAANVFTGAHVSGNLTMNRGLGSGANGGDCSKTSPLTSFGITAITIKLR